MIEAYLSNLIILFLRFLYLLIILLVDLLTCIRVDLEVLIGCWVLI